MDYRPHTVRIWTIWSLVLLLAALVAYLGCIVVVATGEGFAMLP